MENNNSQALVLYKKNSEQLIGCFSKVNKTESEVVVFLPHVREFIDANVNQALKLNEPITQLAVQNLYKFDYHLSRMPLNMKTYSMLNEKLYDSRDTCIPISSLKT